MARTARLVQMVHPAPLDPLVQAAIQEIAGQLAREARQVLPVLQERPVPWDRVDPPENRAPQDPPGPRATRARRLRRALRASQVRS